MERFRYQPSESLTRQGVVSRIRTGFKNFVSRVRNPSPIEESIPEDVVASNQVFRTNRRGFLKLATAAAAGVVIADSVVPAKPAEASQPEDATRDKKDRFGSDAFGLEYESYIKDAELRDDIISYLAEYRFQLPTYEYTLHFSEDRSGAKHIRDKYRGEPMRVKAQRSIEERKARGLPTHREESELQGMIRLEDQLRFAQDGDKIYWASPPGPEEEGYGEYGFLYEGAVRVEENGKLELAMVAIRLEHPTNEQYNHALSLLTGRTIQFNHADSFLEQPFVTKGDRSIDAKKVLKELFFFEDLEGKRQEFYKLIEKLGPTIDEVIHVLKTGTKEEKLKAFYTLENYALYLKDRPSAGNSGQIIYQESDRTSPRLVDLTGVFGYEPPQASGSCGSTKNNLFGSNNIFNNFEFLKKALFGEDESTCQHCQEDSSDNHYHCNKCNHKYADETNKTNRTPACVQCGEKFGC